MNRQAVEDCLNILGDGDSLGGERLLRGLAVELEAARKKHPVFAEGVYEALGRVGAEYGELIQSVEKREPAERVHEEALHLLVTTVRLLNREHEAEQRAGAAHESAENTKERV